MYATQFGNNIVSNGPITMLSQLEVINEITNRRNNDQFVYNRTSDGVDVVYLWTNGTEPFRQKQLQEYIHESTFSSNAHSANRFREWNELYYSLILLFRQALNLRNVVVVTAGERPYYVEQFPQVVWANDSEFIPNEILPTFSSTTIELGLFYLLPQLSDPFIEMNDDWVSILFIHLESRPELLHFSHCLIRSNPFYIIYCTLIYDMYPFA